MRKRIMALLGASAIVALTFAGTPAKAVAAARYFDTYVSQADLTDYPGYSGKSSCKHPDYTDLQDAFNEADDGDEIYLCRGTYYGNFGINDDIAIIGAGRNMTFIDGDDNGDPAISASDDNLSIEALTIQNGTVDGGSGGGIAGVEWYDCFNSTLRDNEAEFNGGAAAVSYVNHNVGCRYENNHAWDGDGGAIYVDYGINEDLNTVYVNNGAGGDGGAVNVNGTDDWDAWFTGSTFTNNETCTDGCAGGGWRHNGGAIHMSNYSDGDLFINRSKFTGNYTDDFGGAVFGGDYVEIVGSSFTNNYSDSDGGAVYAMGDLFLATVKFSGNGAWCDGGAIYSRENVDMANSTFSRNYSDDCSTPGGWISGDLQLWGRNTLDIGWKLVSWDDYPILWSDRDSQWIYVGCPGNDCP